ncbi:DNA repair protein RecN [Flavobacterium kingsejongi]|uniref:DNA repair protein RecN n=1 Tax=Flavobacterium kingsejongi TaxID=1678728 RepID=A0A2S1LS95_9FLAO|nr:DNA repair protein RecN [Flavobacterium kingsejongi]AWG26599.1 DNA repair protein RecN [Flavobacterium kingsejongi]
MLTTLSIKNFALIEKLDIAFSDQFSIITGETGAGKSIVLGALGLILGKRADLASLKDKNEKCVIEAHFELSKYSLRPFFEENDLDYEDETIIRREILPSGKSRAFINDSPVNLQELQELGVFLIDIHSQHQTQELSEELYQFQIIDSIAQNNPLVLDYQSVLKKYKSQKSQLAQLIVERQEAIKEQDYNAFLLEELLTAQLKNGQQEELEERFEQLNNVEFIKESLVKVTAIANDDQIGVLQHLKEIKNTLHKIASFSTTYNQFYERTNSVLLELDDIVEEISEHSEKLLNDPEQLELINQKLQAIYTLQKKHQVTTVAELLEIQEALDTKVMALDSLEAKIASIEKEIAAAAEKLDGIAAKIHAKRQKAIPVFQEKIVGILQLLGMPNARFAIEINPRASYFQNGKDEIQLLFSANKGSDFGLLKKVASGGEMSRIMLSVKAILAEYSKLPTIIFDEIDTGVSGEIAQKMGDIMKKMSREMQVFAITHLPQIASKGDQHYKVSKSTQGENTVSELKLLNTEDRIIEIAQMLSGNEITESAIGHAKALLN